jgi:zinc D-Ala-D-Ala dipeptidase
MRKLLFIGLFATAIAHADSMPDDFVDVSDYLPEAVYDIRYYTGNNFVGDKVDGYLAPKCILQKQAAEALVKVAEQAAGQGLVLMLFDCYRPQRAVDHFLRWAQDLADTRTKQAYYPNLGKDKLVGEYIADRSGHSRGATIDLTLARRDAEGHWQELDMGSPFDMFDPVSNTDHPGIGESQHRNRQLLKTLMEGQGFSNYPLEWWHFSLVPEPYPETYFDFPVR